MSRRTTRKRTKIKSRRNIRSIKNTRRNTRSRKYEEL